MASSNDTSCMSIRSPILDFCVRVLTIRAIHSIIIQGSRAAKGSQMKRLIVGCGYLGGRVAQRWLGQGDDVHVLTRSASRAKMLSDLDLRPLVGDLTDPGSCLTCPAVDTLLFAVGWDRSSGKTIREVYVDGLKHLLARLPNSNGRVVYISSTGVYGQTSGERVDEDLRLPAATRRRTSLSCRGASLLLATRWLSEP